MSTLLRPDWTLAKAIKRQVDKEDLVRWALTPTLEHKVIPPMPRQRWKAAPLRAFLSSIIP
jgi:hypothetical protein